jgi:hypothetical protein
VAADDMPVDSLGVRAMIILINVTGTSAAPIPNRKSDPVIPEDVEWYNVMIKNDADIITIPGINNFVFSSRLFTINIPNTGPNISIANERGNCSRPVPLGSSPRPEPSGAAPN